MRESRRASGAVWAASRSLRRRETTAERVLCQALRRRRLSDLIFRRQHAVGSFVLDFYCPAERLAIELDGGVHDDPSQRRRDEQRTSALEAAGITVLRFRNDAVTGRLAQVLSTIAAASSKSNIAPQPPLPVPTGDQRQPPHFDS
ncbi:MAG: endonuclease domain-containing protein [Ardenticatenales bacterium]|nr:endonuclease domain-containing protein [Ardenticatenales bacterium]